MNPKIAKYSGFCFGVKIATDKIEARLKDRRAGERIFTLGHLIHNDTYNEMLKKSGVGVAGMDNLEDIAKSATEISPVSVYIRAHGVLRGEEERLASLAAENPHFGYVDCTCPYVKKIHNIARENSREENFFLLCGAAEHPEVRGILSYFDYGKAVFDTAAELEAMISSGELEVLNRKTPIVAVQTTQNLAEWKKSQQILKKLYTNARVFDTICSVTELRQKEAEELSSECDLVIVIGGRESSNTAKLYSICKKNCTDTIRVESPSELAALNLIPFARKKVGIAAGASTPSGVIQEVWKIMHDTTENFEELLESSLKTLNTGDTVKGIVTMVSDAEVQLDLGVNVTGVIKAAQITDDPTARLTELYKKGDEIEAFVIKVSDIEGVAELSKKRVDSDKNWQKIVNAGDSAEVLTGKVVEIIKGGIMVSANSNKIFVPMSHTGIPRDGDVNTLKGKTVNLRIIEVSGKRAVGSIRDVLRDERRAKAAAFWDSIEEGKVYTGTVKSLTAYGAFVDLGGIDGMVHKSELSWQPISKPADIVSVGDEITVFVKSFDAEKKRISLGYKTEATNPWNKFIADYTVGSIVSVKIVNMMPFGAFAEIIDGVDGLIHISQIAARKIGKPSDELTLGQTVDAKIIAIDEENQKISLSIRALLEELGEFGTLDYPTDYILPETEE